MAAWLKMSVDLPEKPEVWQIAGRCTLDPDAVVGKLLKVWRWFDSHTEDGNGVGVTASMLDYIAGATGFADAMLHCGWLVPIEGGLGLSKFDLHNGETAKKRALTAKRVAAHRGNGNATRNAAGVTPSVPRERVRDRDNKNPPVSPQGGSTPEAGDAGEAEAKPKAGKRSEKCTWPEFLQQCQALGESPLPSAHPVWAYAESIGLPDEFVVLAWSWFKRRRAGGKQKGVRGWRQAFDNCVRDNWGRLWCEGREGGWVLTTAGEQARREQAAEGVAE